MSLNLELPDRCKTLSVYEQRKLIVDWQVFLKRKGELKKREVAVWFESFVEGWLSGHVSGDALEALDAWDELGEWFTNSLPFEFGQTVTRCISHSYNQTNGATTYACETTFSAGEGHPRYPSGIKYSYIVGEKNEAKAIHESVVEIVTMEYQDTQV